MKLDIGSGTSSNDQFVNLDIRHHENVDVIANVENSLPVKSGSIDKIRANFLLEHLDDPFTLLQEAYRVLKINGKLQIKVPHADSPTFKEHPDHKSPFTYETIPMLTGSKKDTEQYFKYNFSVEEFSFYYIRSTFWPLTGLLIKWFNKFPGSLKFVSQLLSADIRMFIILEKRPQ